MPTYTYECKKCKKTYDVFQKMSDAPLKKCLHCKATPKRLIGKGGGIIFKGSGWTKKEGG